MITIAYFRPSIPELVCAFPVPLTPNSTLLCAGRTPKRPALVPTNGIGHATRRWRWYKSRNSSFAASRRVRRVLERFFPAQGASHVPGAALA